MQRTRRGGRRPAFTLVELLIVIVVIGVLVAIILTVSAKVSSGQKGRNTENIMRTVSLAIDQFATVDPLKSVYNSVRNKTFGPYPPYQLRNAPDTDPNSASLVHALEPDPPGTGSRNFLVDRLGRDMLGITNDSTPAATLVRIDDAATERRNDDIRALYAYLAVYTPQALNQVPEAYRKPLTNYGEFVNPSGVAGNVQQRVEVFGIYDAWGVPLDYFLYVKLEWGIVTNPVTGVQGAGVRVADRIPVLRSRGVSLEEFQAQQAAYTGNNPEVFAPEKWVFSEPFPSPPAPNMSSSGVFGGSSTQYNGWARAVALDETYSYLPE